MIREAVRTDRDQLFGLYKMLVPNSRKMNVQEEQIEVVRNDPHTYLFVYEEEGVLIGTVTLNICLQAMHGLRPYGVVENIVVHEDHRGKRVGQALLQHVEDICQSLNCHRIMLLSNATRHQAHRFFEREGFDGSVSRGFKKYF
ncbi:acetyltransferase [Paenibacillus sp. J31TS4]|uniref:GNAT family N-acetyltransferase n=1 Tax=Paenibacillus sp. J31TS4 TaxID=2807195 RepID=UPI001B13B4A7|nr:GNAT family N-acetyltransferase [Paenibacillus sp. J31TS4]GIP39101.1 acetyltransferase [Paenibacillus sp. J31TS4]